MADIDELKAKIMEWANKQSKPKFYFKDFSKAAPELSLREIKKAVTALVQDEKLELWSSGSTSMYGVKGKGLTEEQQMGALKKEE